MSDSATKYNVVGTRPIRPDGVGKVTGRDRFGADMAMPGQLTGLVLRSPHAHARIKSIRTSKGRGACRRQGGGDGGRPVGDPLGRGLRRRGADELPRPLRQHAGAPQGALRRPRRGRRGRDLGSDRPGGLGPDRGGLRDPAPRHRCRRRHEGRGADPARRPLHRRGRADADDGIERRQEGRVQARRPGGGLRQGRGRGRGPLHHQARAPGLYRAARLRRLDGRGRPDPDLVVEPGPVHGPRLYGQSYWAATWRRSGPCRPRSAAALAARR